MKKIIIFVVLSLIANGLRQGGSIEADKSPVYPSEIFTCDGPAAQQTDFMGEDLYEQIVRDIHDQYKVMHEDDPDDLEDDHHFVGCIVRFAGHDFMDFRVNSTEGGSDGCMNLVNPDNAGLANCVREFGYITSYKNFCEQVSLADFLVIAAEAAMAIFSKETVSVTGELALNDENSLYNKFKSKFQYGRKTLPTCPVKHLMPVPDDGCNGPNGIDTVFVKNVYHNAPDTATAWRWTAAISGAHTIGGTNLSHSGIPHKTWVPDAESRRFDNKYYQHMVVNSWIPQVHPETSGTAAWSRAGRLWDEAHVLNEFMLITDLCLLWDVDVGGLEATTGAASFPISGCDNIGDTAGCYNPPEEAIRFTHESECCAWVHHNVLREHNIPHDNKLCEFDTFGSMFDTSNAIPRDWCCSRSQGNTQGFGDCQDPNLPSGPAAEWVLKYAADNTAFIDDFVEAWNIATSNNHDLLLKPGSCHPTKKPCDKLRKCVEGKCSEDELCGKKENLICTSLLDNVSDQRCNKWGCFRMRSASKPIKNRCNDRKKRPAGRPHWCKCHCKT